MQRPHLLHEPSGVGTDPCGRAGEAGTPRYAGRAEPEAHRVLVAAAALPQPRIPGRDPLDQQSRRRHGPEPQAGLGLPELEIGARFKYEQNPSTWSSEITDGDGVARFVDEHPEPPAEVSLYVGDALCDSFPVEDGAMLVLEV